MSRLRSQDGFTLPELLVTMAIAMIVSLATFSLIEIVMKRSGDVGARVETTATGRTAMDQITRQLRSQVCAKRATMGTARSIDVAGPASLTVFADFTNENVSGGIMPAPDLRTISWANNIFIETVVKGTRRDTDNSVSYAGTGTSRQFLTTVVATEFFGGDQTKPIFFRYYKFPDAGTIGANADDLDRAVKILSRRPAAKAARPFGIAPERAETLLAGALLLAGASRVLGTPFKLGSGGLREGASLELAGARDAIRAA
jgi:prepilin-type N-terminal cleavage/methylation domain-containing protein